MTTLSASSYIYIGCYGDSSTRAMPTSGGYDVTVSTCAGYAKSNGFSFFGLQYYGQGKGTTTGECWVSNSLVDSTQYGTSSATCSIGADGKNFIDFYEYNL